MVIRFCQSIVAIVPIDNYVKYQHCLTWTLSHNNNPLWSKYEFHATGQEKYILPRNRVCFRTSDFHGTGPLLHICGEHEVSLTPD